MRIDINRDEFQTIINCLKGNPLKCEAKTRANLLRNLEWQLTGKGPDDPRRKFVPVRIRSYWPDGQVKRSSRPNWSFHKPRTGRSSTDKKGINLKEVKKQPTADEILSML